MKEFHYKLAFFHYVTLLPGTVHISTGNLVHSSIIMQQIHANNIQNNDTMHVLKNKDLNHCCLNFEGKKLFIFSNYRIH